MDDEEGKGVVGAGAAAAAAGAAGASEGTGNQVAAEADVQAKASTTHSTADRTNASAESPKPAEPSTSTPTSTPRATGEDGNDAGTKMNHNLPNAFHHGSGPGYYDPGAAAVSRHPLPTALPARSSNSFTPINNFARQDDHAPTTLPPISSINSLPPPQPQPQRQRTSLPTARPAPSATPAPPATSNVSYYPGHTDGRLLPSNYGISPGEAAQYALLPPEPKEFQRTVVKKIKRRTKTGCMTCRKRRIKCDEAHPSCNNCKKSKRECLGYDPVFREQSIPGHSNPASNSKSSPAPSSPSSRGPETPSSHPDSYVPPRLETPTPNESFGRPLPTAAPYIAPEPSRDTRSWWRAIIENLHYPIIQAADGSVRSVESTRHWHTGRIKSEPAEPSRSGTFFDPITSTVSESREASNRPETHSSGEERRSRLPDIMRVADLINGFGANAPLPEPVQSEEQYQEVVRVYHEMYANGLYSFFESTWFFFTDNGKMSFPRTGNTAGHIATFLKLIKGANIEDHAFMAHCSVVELRLVWELAKLASTAAPDKADNRMRVTLPPAGDAIEVKNRFSVVDALLGGDFLPWNPLTPSAEDEDTHRVQEFDFWYQLGEFLRYSADKDPAEEDKRRQDTIDRMRWLLGGRENRDVLYSIVVLRHYGTRFDMVEAMKAKYHLPEGEAHNRAVVASKFIIQQAQVKGGTTNVIRRICDIASRLYVRGADATTRQ